MNEVVTEREWKLVLPDGEPLPDLGVIFAGEDVEIVGPPPFELRATYYDTADLRLLGSGATLRRRTGGSDAGWHLKVATDEQHTRTEIRRPLDAEPAGEGSVPPELAELVFARLRGAPLKPVAELHTHRSVLEVRTASGEPLVEVADDLVEAHTPGCSPPARWREVEVELVGDGGPAAARILERLRQAGAVLDDGGPKLARALGVRRSLSSDRPPHARRRRHVHRAATLTPRRVVGDRPDGAGGGGSGAPPAGARSANGAASGADPRRRSKLLRALIGHLAGQSEELAVCDLSVRRHQPEAVHDMRVASRRLSSALSTFGPLFDEPRSEHLRCELRWLAGLLGAARDLEVLRARVESELESLPGEQLLGPVRATLTDRLVGEQAVAGERLREAMRSDRYARLLDELSGFVAEPPWRPAAPGELERAALEGVSRVVRSVRRRMRDAARLTGTARSTTLHGARKRAKRARYGLEALAPALGRPATRLAGRYEKLQSALGTHHDAVVLSSLLREEGARAGVRVGENGYTFGVLAGMQRYRAAAAEGEAWQAFERAERRGGRGFLRRAL